VLTLKFCSCQVTNNFNWTTHYSQFGGLGRFTNVLGCFGGFLRRFSSNIASTKVKVNAQSVSRHPIKMDLSPFGGQELVGFFPTVDSSVSGFTLGVLNNSNSIFYFSRLLDGITLIVTMNHLHNIILFLNEFC